VLVVNQETGVHEFISESEWNQHRKFNELVAATPLAWVTVALIVINVGVFLGMLIGGVSPLNPTTENLLAWGANYGPLTLHGQWWRLVTAAFAHAGLLHLGFNMYCLFRVGFFAERIFGNARFAAIYLLSGIGGNLASLYWHPMVAGVGASGAVFGVYGAVLGFMVAQPNLLPLARAQALTKDVLVFIGINFVYGITAPKIDMAAHIGGLVTGFVLSAALGRTLSLPKTGLWSQTVAAAAVVLIAVAAGAGLASRIPMVDDYLAEIKRLVSVEQTSLKLFNESLLKWKRKEVNPAELAGIINRQLLPPWNQERERITKLRIPREETRVIDRLKKLSEYMALRADGWTLMARGLAANDVSMIFAANAKQSQAEAVLRAMSNNAIPGTRP
jgi:rhomboid protease GluP